MYKTTHVCGKLQSQHSVKRLAGKIGLKKVLFLSLWVSGGLAEGFKTAARRFVVDTIWKRGRVVDCTGLENQQRATFREFESHRLRQKPLSRGFFLARNSLKNLKIPGKTAFVEKYRSRLLAWNLIWSRNFM